jgi:hypothetical protein
MDLIQLWEDHRLISTLPAQMRLTEYATCTTFRFDSIYSQILSRSPELLFVLKTQIISPQTLRIMLEDLGFPFNNSIFQPFAPVRGLLEFPFPDGDSPVDFLNNPRRAGNLYSDPQDIADTFMRRWLTPLKQDLLDGWHHLNL